MNRRSNDLSPLRLVFVGDGANWIWCRVGDLDNERSRHILDFCHAADHLADACKAIDGEGSDRFHERFKRWRASLREGGAAQLIVELKQLRDTAAGARQRDLIQSEISYFEANCQRNELPTVPRATPADCQRHRGESLQRTSPPPA